MPASIESLVGPLHIRTAAAGDLPTVLTILGQAAAWLIKRGVDQWPSPPNEHWRRRTAERINKGCVYLARREDETVATFQIAWSDPAYWPHDPDGAGYIHQLALSDQYHGLGVGAALLDWAIRFICQMGKLHVRLDCQAGNGRLRRYYEEQGFTYRGQITDRDYQAALYERDCRLNDRLPH